jgi:DNA-binding NarL/FixJ family response regulator
VALQYTGEFREHVLDLIQQSMPYAKTVNQGDNLMQFNSLLGSIASACKLEGISHLANVTEHLIHLVDSIQSSAISPKEETINTILLTLSYVDNVLRNDIHDDRLDVIDRMDLLLDKSKHEENDYVTQKKINTLYIDNDPFSRHYIEKSIDKSINLVWVESAAEATELLKNTKFDTILCNLDLSDSSLLNIFKLYSSKIPIIALSQDDSPKAVQVATKLGAKDFILKDKLNIKWIPRSLHSVVQQQRKHDKRSRLQSVLNNSDARVILKEMLNSNLPIVQRVYSTRSNKLEVNEVINDMYKLNINDVLKKGTNAIELLSSSDLVIKRQLEMSIACPQCRSPDLISHYLCPFCNQSDFVAIKSIVYHSACGYSDDKGKFKISDEILVCPRCKLDLSHSSSSNKFTYNEQAGFKCNQCAKVFPLPKIDHTCTKCNLSNFEIANASWIQLYEYMLNQDKLDYIKQNVLMIEPVSDLLRSQNYEIQINHKFILNGEEFGPFELVARKESQKHFIIISVLDEEIDDNIECLIQLDTLSKNIDSTFTKYAITLYHEPEEIIKNLMIKFDIIPITLENFGKDMLNIFVNSFTQHMNGRI